MYYNIFMEAIHIKDLLISFSLILAIIVILIGCVDSVKNTMVVNSNKSSIIEAEVSVKENEFNQLDSLRNKFS